MILIPIFFAAAGERVDPAAIDGSVIAAAAVFLTLSTAVAALAGAAAAQLPGISQGEARSIAALRNCRGLVLLALAVSMIDQPLIGAGLVTVFSSARWERR